MDPEISIPIARRICVHVKAAILSTSPQCPLTGQIYHRTRVGNFNVKPKTKQRQATWIVKKTSRLPLRLCTAKYNRKEENKGNLITDKCD